MAVQELIKSVPFTAAIKMLKYLGVNSTKEVKGLYNKIYIALKKNKRRSSLPLEKSFHVYKLKNFTNAPTIQSNLQI